MDQLIRTYAAIVLMQCTHFHIHRHSCIEVKPLSLHSFSITLYMWINIEAAALLHTEYNRAIIFIMYEKLALNIFIWLDLIRKIFIKWESVPSRMHTTCLGFSSIMGFSDFLSLPSLTNSLFVLFL